MQSPRRIAVVVTALAYCVCKQAAASTSSSCSGDELQQVQTRIAEIRASLTSDANSGSEATSVPASCKAALTFDAAASGDDDELCATNCLVWIEDVVDTSTCGDEEMLMYQRRMAAYLAQCSDSDSNQVRRQAVENVEESKIRLRGLAQDQAGRRNLGVKGLLDALLVVTLNNAL